MRWQLIASSVFGVACFVLLALGTATVAIADGEIDPGTLASTCVDNNCTGICCVADPDPPITCATNVGGIQCNTADSDCKCKTQASGTGSCVCWK